MKRRAKGNLNEKEPQKTIVLNKVEGNKTKQTRILHKFSDSHFRLTKVVYQRSNLDKLLD